MNVHKIVSQEVQNRDPGRMYIDTKCPREFVTDAMIRDAVEYYQLEAGYMVYVRSFNHEMTQVLHFTEYLVAGKVPEMRRTENFNGDSQSKEVFNYTLVQLVPWTATPFAKTEAETKKKAA